MFNWLFRRHTSSTSSTSSTTPTVASPVSVDAAPAASLPARADDAAEPRRVLAELLNNAQGLINAGENAQAVQLLAPHSARYQTEAAFLAAYGVVLYLAGHSAESIVTLTALLALEPEHAMALKFLSGAYYQTGQAPQGIAVAQRAVALGAADEQVYNALGAMYLNVGDNRRALEAFQAAVITNPKDLQALANLETLQARFSALGLAETRDGKIAVIRDAAIANLEAQLQRGVLSIGDAGYLAQIIGLRRHSWSLALQLVDVFAYRTDMTAGLAASLSATCYYAARFEDSLRLSEIAFELSPDTVEIRNERGSRLVRGGQERWLEGWQMMADTNRLLNPNNYPDTLPVWRGQNLDGQKLFVHFDQGIGDALMTLRFLDHLSARGITTLLWLLPAIADLVTHIPRGVELIRADFMPDPRQLGCAYSCGLLDLPAGLGLQPGDIGAFGKLVAPAAARLLESDPERLTLGLVAMGNPKRADDWLRTVLAADLAPLGALEGVRWINLSVDRHPELDVLIEQLAMLDPTSQLTSFAATAAMLFEVDGVIAIDCAAAHLAGALGRPLWVLQPTLEDWRWQIGSAPSPWWPAARVFRADGPGRWTEAVARLAVDLTNWQSERSART